MHGATAPNGDRRNRDEPLRRELADFVRVESADLNDGLLVIELVREVPEAMKPKKIAIGAGEASGGDGAIEHRSVA